MEELAPVDCFERERRLLPAGGPEAPAAALDSQAQFRGFRHVRRCFSAPGHDAICPNRLTKRITALWSRDCADDDCWSPHSLPPSPSRTTPSFDESIDPAWCCIGRRCAPSIPLCNPLRMRAAPFPARSRVRASRHLVGGQGCGAAAAVAHDVHRERGRRSAHAPFERRGSDPSLRRSVRPGVREARSACMGQRRRCCCNRRRGTEGFLAIAAFP